MSNCLFAFNQLSFKDHDTLERLCSHLETLIDNTSNSAVLRSVLTSLGQLKFLHSPIMEGVIAWHQNRLNQNLEMDVRDMVSIIKTCAILNYYPTHENASLLKVN